MGASTVTGAVGAAASVMAALTRMEHANNLTLYGDGSTRFAIGALVGSAAGVVIGWGSVASYADQGLSRPLETRAAEYLRDVMNCPRT
jgi:hypothetical protein